jgi:ribonuclease HI
MCKCANGLVRDSRLKTQDAGRKTQDAGRNTQDAIRNTQYTRRQMDKIIKLYTDGASTGNPGPGGFGAILEYGMHHKEISKGFRLTTNNRMELLAVIEGLKAIKNPEIPVQIYSDSQYVVNAIQKRWVFGWHEKGFKGKKNKDLWMEFLKLYPKFKLKIDWVRGHNGHIQNERCDVLATTAALYPHNVDEGYEKGWGE